MTVTAAEFNLVYHRNKCNKSSAVAKIARHASLWIPPKCSTPHFLCPG